MKIAFDINGTLKRPTLEETKVMIEVLKLLKRAGHFIIVWSSDNQKEINKFLKEYKITGYVDLAVNKMLIESKDRPEIAFDDNEFIYLPKGRCIKV